MAVVSFKPTKQLRRRLLVAGGITLALVAAYLAGRFAGPTKTVEKEVRVLDKSMVAKAVASARAEWQREVEDRSVTTTYYGPSGKPTRKVQQKHVDLKAGGSSVASSQTDVATKANETSATSKVTERARPGWRAGVTAAWSPGQLSVAPDHYGIELDRRLFGTVWLGVRADTDKTVGASLSLEW